MGLRGQVAGFGVTDTDQGILMHQASDDRRLTFAFDQLGTVIVDHDAQVAGRRGAVAVRDGVGEGKEEIVLVATSGQRRLVIQRG